MKMSRQFSIPTVLRMTPNALLKAYFINIGIDLGIKWEEIGEREIETPLRVLSQLSQADHDKVESGLHSVFDLACEGGINAFIEAAIKCNELNFAQAMPQSVGHYHKSMWVYLNRPEIFNKAFTIHRVDNFSWWRKRNDLPKVECDRSAEAIQQLETEISGLLTLEQGRGQQCTVESFSRADGTDYFYCSPDNFIENITAHDHDGKLSPQTLRQTFVIVFAYNRSEGSLEMHAPVPPKLKAKLEAIFARVILDTELGIWAPEASYKLDHLKDSAFELWVDPKDSVKVAIKRMKFRCKNSSRQITVEVDVEDPLDNIRRAIADMISQEVVPLTEMYLASVTLCIEFLPVDGRKPGTSTFDVSYPSTCNLRNQRPERVTLIKKYLREWNIDRVQSPVADPATTGG